MADGLRELKKGMWKSGSGTKKCELLSKARSFGFTDPLILSGGMRKSGSVEKQCADARAGAPPVSSAADLSSEGMRKTGSAKKQCSNSAGLALFVPRCQPDPKE